MNEFLFRCRHPLVPLLFHEVTSLHPLHFREMIFPLVLITFGVCIVDGPKVCTSVLFIVFSFVL